MAIHTIRTDRLHSLVRKIMVINTFFKYSYKHRKVNIFTRGEHFKIMQALEEHLKENHKINYTNFKMKYSEALEFLFPMAFIGMSNRHRNSKNSGYEVVEKVARSRMVPASYAFLEVLRECQEICI